MTVDDQKYVVWLADGGTTHMLCNLGACLRYAAKTGRQILPVSINQSTLKDHFYRFFDLQQHSHLARYFVPPENYCHVFWGYEPAHKELPARLSETKIDKERIDLDGRVYYTLGGVESIGGNVRYLDYPRVETPKYILTWGGFEKYFPKQLHIVTTTIRLHSSISADVFGRISNTKASLDGADCISVHFRNTDYASDINSLFSQVDETLRHLPNSKIFWATDDRSSLDTAMARYGSRIVPGCVNVDVKLVPGLGSLHSLGDKELAYFPGVTRATLFADFMHDVYYMSTSRKHFSSAGNVGFLVNTLRQMCSSSLQRFFGFH